MTQTLNIQQLADDFWRDGYVVLESFFAEPLMQDIQKRILQYYGETPDYFHDDDFLQKSATEVIPWFPQREGVAIFDQVENNPQLNALTQAILGESWQSLYCMAMFSRKGSKGQAWHQDCPPDNSNAFNLNRLVYTMDVGGDIGGELLVVPGSHKLGEISAGQVDEDLPEQKVFSPKKGTLVLVHGHTWHRVLPVHGRYRVSTNFRAIPEGVAEDITDICVYRNMRYQFSTSTLLVDRELA